MPSIPEPEETGAPTRENARDSAARALGLDPTLIPWPGEGEPMRAEEVAAEPSRCKPLSEPEWQALVPLLPAQAPQARAMGNRDFLDAVLEAVHRGGRWSARDIPATRSEAVRRRFARWAHLGVFEGLAAALKGLPLSAEHRLLLALACHRAQTLKRCTGR